MHTPTATPQARRDTIAAARDWLDTPPPDPGIGAPTFRHIAAAHTIIEALVAHLERLAAAARPACPGAGQFVHADRVDADRICICPVCMRDASARPAGDVHDMWWIVTGHRARTTTP